MSSKIRVRMGEVEVEYEGEEAFLTNGLPDLLQSVADLYANLASARKPKDAGSAGAVAAAGETAIAKSEQQLQMSINTIAAKLAVKKGPDLVMATLAHSEIIERRDRTARADIATEMRNATGFFKTSYVGNLSTNLTSLVKSGKVRELTKDVFALSAEAKNELAAKLTAQ